MYAERVRCGEFLPLPEGPAMGRDVVDLIGGMEVSTVPEKWMVIREKRSVWHTIRSVVLDPVVLLFVIAHIRSSTSDARIEASGDLILLAIVTLLQPDSSPGDERESNGEDDQHDDPLLEIQSQCLSVCWVIVATHIMILPPRRWLVRTNSNAIQVVLAIAGGRRSTRRSSCRPIICRRRRRSTRSSGGCSSSRARMFARTIIAATVGGIPCADLLQICSTTRRVANSRR